MTAKRYIALAAFAWGEAPSITVAIRRCRSHIPSFVKVRDVNVYEVGPTARVNDKGDIVYDKGEAAPVLVREVRAA